MTTTIRAIAIVTIVALIVGFCASAPVIATTYTFNTTRGSWSDEGHWTPEGGPPSGGDVALIPDDKTVEVDSNESCGKLQVSDTGAVEIFGTFRLTITDATIQLDSEVDGEIRFMKYLESTMPGTLRMDGDITISGDGGAIFGGDEHDSLIGGVIDGADGSATLTLSQTGGGLVVRDEIEIKVELANNAEVGCTVSGDTLTLSTHAKSGSGLWIATAGTLKVDAEVTGSGSFEIGSASTTGTLDANENIDVSGSLTVRGYTSLDFGEQFSTIDVASGKSAKFHVCTGGSCP